MLSLCGCMDFSQLQHTGATLVARASHCSGFCCGAWALGCACFNSWACQAQEHRLSRCGVRASLLQDTWDLPRPGIEPVPPALAGGFFTTEPPGKPLQCILDPFPSDRARCKSSQFPFSDSEMICWTFCAHWWILNKKLLLTEFWLTFSPFPNPEHASYLIKSIGTKID